MEFEQAGQPKGFKNERQANAVRSYSFESGVTVEVTSRVFRTEKSEDPSRATVFLPGWAMGAHKKSVEDVCRAFAKESGADTHAVTTSSKVRGAAQEQADLLYEEARAVKRFIEENGLHQVTLVGHSQGGDKAIDLASILRKDPDVQLDGLVLIDPVGLYEQGAIELAAKFTKHSLVDHVTSVGRSIKASPLKGMKNIAPAMRAGNNVVAGITKEAWRSGLDYWSRFKSEVTEMARKNPHTQEVQVPIVIVTGLKDAVSDMQKIIPAEAIAPLRQELGEVNS